MKQLDPLADENVTLHMGPSVGEGVVPQDEEFQLEDKSERPDKARPVIRTLAVCTERCTVVDNVPRSIAGPTELKQDAAFRLMGWRDDHSSDRRVHIGARAGGVLVFVRVATAGHGAAATE